MKWNHLQPSFRHYPKRSVDSEMHTFFFVFLFVLSYSLTSSMDRRYLAMVQNLNASMSINWRHRWRKCWLIQRRGTCNAAEKDIRIWNLVAHHVLTNFHVNKCNSLKCIKCIAIIFDSKPMYLRYRVKPSYNKPVHAQKCIEKTEGFLPFSIVYIFLFGFIWF